MTTILREAEREVRSLKTGSRRDWEFMNVNIVVGKEIPALVTGAGLADVSGGANVVDRDVIRRDETGEMEELPQVALCNKWHHNHSDLGVHCHLSILKPY
ncbi:hypothetical protein AgCh_004867 [Apium graveolens]